MENFVLQQGYLFFVYIVSGILIGILFDIFRVLRKTFKTPDIITYIEDALFWILTGIFLLFILFKFSSGEIRIYNILGLIIGATLYILTISKYFMQISVKIAKFVKNIISKIIKVLVLPVKFLLKVLRKIFKPFTFFVINIRKIFINFNKKVKKEKLWGKIKIKRRILKTNVEK